MQTTLLNYIAELNANPQLQAKHQAAPQQTAIEFGLSAQEAKNLSSKSKTLNYTGLNPQQVKSLMVGAFIQY